MSSLKTSRIDKRIVFEERERLQAVITSIGDGICEMDPAGAGAANQPRRPAAAWAGRKQELIDRSLYWT